MALGFKKKTPTGAAEELREVIGDTELASFPSVILEALSTIRRPDVSAREVAEVLRADPGATMRLLKLVNSAVYAPVRPITTVDQAVAIAGLGAVESMLLAVGVNVALPKETVEGLNQQRFWSAAARRGAIAKTFAHELHPATAGHCFTAALLQDMAVPLIAVSRPDYRPLLVEWHGGGEDLHQLESSAFGWSHDHVGELLSSAWELPEDLARTIGGHHGNSDHGVPPAIELAAPFREIGNDDVIDFVVSTASDDHGLTPEQTISLLDRAEEEAKHLALLFS